MTKGKNLFGGFVWGLATAIKYLPVIFIVPFLNLKNRRVVPGLLSGFFLLNLICFFWMGNQVYLNYFSVLLNHANGSISGQSPFAYQFQSWNVILRRLFVFDATQNPNPLINSELLFEGSRLLVYGIVAGIAAKTIFDLRKSNQFIELSIAVIGISVFEILPASATYHFILLLFPTVFLLKNLLSKNDEGYFALILILFACINCLPIILQKIISADSPFIFYRFYLVTLFYFAAIWVVRKKISDLSFVMHHA